MLTAPVLTVSFSAVDRLDADDVEQIVLPEPVRHFVVARRDSNQHARTCNPSKVGVFNHVGLAIGELNFERLERGLMQDVINLMISHASLHDPVNCIILPFRMQLGLDGRFPDEFDL